MADFDLDQIRADMRNVTTQDRALARVLDLCNEVERLRGLVRKAYDEGASDTAARLLLPGALAHPTWETSDALAAITLAAIEGEPEPDCGAIPGEKPPCRCGHPSRFHGVGNVDACATTGCGCATYTPPGPTKADDNKPMRCPCEVRKRYGWMDNMPTVPKGIPTNPADPMPAAPPFKPAPDSAAVHLACEPLHTGPEAQVVTVGLGDRHCAVCLKPGAMYITSTAVGIVAVCNEACAARLQCLPDPVVAEVPLPAGRGSQPAGGYRRVDDHGVFVHQADPFRTGSTIWHVCVHGEHRAPERTLPAAIAACGNGAKP